MQSFFGRDSYGRLALNGLYVIPGFILLCGCMILWSFIEETFWKIFWIAILVIVVTIAAVLWWYFFDKIPTMVWEKGEIKYGTVVKVWNYEAVGAKYHYRQKIVYEFMSDSGDLIRKRADVCLVRFKVGEKIKLMVYGNRSIALA